MKIRSHVSRAMARERLDSWHASVGLHTRRPSLRIDRRRKRTLERDLDKSQFQSLSSASQSLDLLRFTFNLSSLRVIRRLSCLSHSDHKSSALSQSYIMIVVNVPLRRKSSHAGPPVQTYSFARQYFRIKRSA